MKDACENPVALDGDARTRGRLQAAAYGEAPAVRRSIERRVAEAASLVRAGWARSYLDAVLTYTRDVAPLSLAEMTGVAEGFEVEPETLFAYLHLAVLVDISQSQAPLPAAADGCSAWAAAGPYGAAWIGKNRDFSGESRLPQGIFLHHDAEWTGRRFLCVGSFGAPGAYSSGVNTDGLALADTQIATSDHGVGLCRYFVMGEVLARCATVDDAIAYLKSIRHAGGGSLVLGDAQGRRAAVELGHGTVAVERSEGEAPVARTNHFTDARLAPFNLTPMDEPPVGRSPDRLLTLRRELAGLPQPEMAAWGRKTMASHDDAIGTGLCRHRRDGDAETISTALFATDERSLYFCAGNPCCGEWRRWTL